jgi:hypothetical protein
VLGTALAIFMMIITNIRRNRANFKNEVELVKFVVVFKKWNGTRKIFWKSFYFLKKIIILSAEMPL